MQAQRVVEQSLGCGVIEALRGSPRRLAQRRCGQLEVAAQPGMLRDDERIGVLAGREHPADLAVQQGGAPCGGASRKRLPDQFMAEAQPAVLLDQELLGDGVLAVVEQLDERAAEHGGQQVEIELGADERGRPQRGARRAELVAARRHRVDQRGGQLGPGCLLRKLGQEERVSPRPRVQRIDPASADQLGRCLLVQHVQPDPRGARQRLALACPDRRDDGRRQAQPAG